MLSLAQLNQIELNQLHKEREQSDPDPELWRWSPLEIAEFARMLEIARTCAMDGLRRLVFLEAGSGIGTKLYLAQYHFGMTAIGYEINKEYIALARDLPVNTVEADLRTEDIAWDDGDIVYVARPLKSDEADQIRPDAREIELEQKIMDRMRPGAVYMAAYAAVKPRWPCYYRRPFKGVWVKPGGRLPNVYTAMIAREIDGSDPLVPEPSTLG
jgi:hypothetical protein